MTRTAFFSHKAKDAELAKEFRDALQRVLPIQIFLSEEISDRRYGWHLRRQASSYCSSLIRAKTGPGAFTKAGFYSSRKPRLTDDKWPIYCLHPKDTEPPNPLANLETVKAETADIEQWIKDLCELLKCRPPSPRSINAAAKHIEQVVEARSVFTEQVIKPYVWVKPFWPQGTPANFNAVTLPAMRFEDALVEIDHDSAIMLGFRSAPKKLDLLHFLKRLDCDSSQNGEQRPYWMAGFFDSLTKAVSGDLNLQEVEYFRHEEGTILRPIIVSGAKCRDGSECKLKVLFAQAYSPPLTDHPTLVQRFSDGVRLAIRTRIEVIEAFLGRMSQIYRDKITSDSPAEEVARNFPVGSRVVKALEAINQEAQGHGFRPGPPPLLFLDPVDQQHYENIRAEALRIWKELDKVAAKEDQDAKGQYLESEKLLEEVEGALSRSWVLLVNRAWRSLQICLYFNALGPSWSNQIGSKIAYTWRM